MRLFCLSLVLAGLAFAQTPSNPACPGATGTLPHCVVLSWLAPTSGATPTGYNVYGGSTTAGQCATVNTATCPKVATVTTPALTVTVNSTASLQFTEGATYHFVITSINATAESTPSVEAVTNPVPFLLPGTPQAPTGTAK